MKKKDTDVEKKTKRREVPAASANESQSNWREIFLFSLNETTVETDVIRVQYSIIQSWTIYVTTKNNVSAIYKASLRLQEGCEVFIFRNEIMLLVLLQIIKRKTLFMLETELF